MNFFLNMIFVAFILACACFDIRENRIPNILTIPFSVIAIAIQVVANGFEGFLFSIMGLAAGIGMLLVPYLLRGMGAGDVKLMGAVGSFLGAKAALEAFLLVAIFGVIYSVAFLIQRRDVFRGFFKEALVVPILLFSGAARLQDLSRTSQNETSGRRPRLKYGVPIALGTITYLILKSFGIQSFS